jgi:pyruvate dehydrogenase E1 component
MAVIVQDGLRRMYKDQENVFYYITALNENYQHPSMPENVEEGIIKGMYLFKESVGEGIRVQLLGSGAILREVIAASSLLVDDFGIKADVWSVPSFTLLRREGLEAERWNLLHPEETPRISYVESCLTGRSDVVVAATDYMKAFADQIRQFVPQSHYQVLGTDGFGRSDMRKQLRKFFEVDRYYIVIAALKGLADSGAIPSSKVSEAISKYGIDPSKPNPTSV